MNDFKDIILNKTDDVQCKGDEQCNKSLAKRNLIEMIRILNANIKYIIHMSHNDSQTRVQDKERMREGLGEENYCHIQIEDLRTIKLSDLNPKTQDGKTKSSLSIQWQNEKQLSNTVKALENLNPNNCIFCG